MRNSEKLKANGRLIVDTNAVIAYREGIAEVCEIMDSADALFLPVIVVGELLYGAINSARPYENRQATDNLISISTLIFIDKPIAVQYANVRLALKKKGFPIPENDLWIAATCLEFDLPLLSSDRHFNYVPGLNVINWAKSDC
jgi:tRNA(fMet)-specific endonuclease VapC